jgi:hypothetical protein
MKRLQQLPFVALCMEDLMFAQKMDGKPGLRQFEPAAHNLLCCFVRLLAGCVYHRASSVGRRLA